MREEYTAKGVRIIDFAGMQALTDTMRVMVAAAAALGAPQDVDAIHAEVTETSIMMARHPALVAADRLEQGRMGHIETEELFRRGLRAITPNGILGDARRASPRIGEVVLEKLADHVVTFVRQRLGEGQR